MRNSHFHGQVEKDNWPRRLKEIWEENQEDMMSQKPRGKCYRKERGVTSVKGCWAVPENGFRSMVDLGKTFSDGDKQKGEMART